MKKRLRELLRQSDFDALSALAMEKRRVLGLLTSLTFDADPLIVWRAIEAMGLAAARIAEKDRACVRDHLRRLQWLLSDESGGVCWHAPEAMAEIVRSKPDLFAAHIPIIVHLILTLAPEDLRPFKPGLLWAIGRLGDLCGVHIQAALPAIESALDDHDSQVRGMAVYCLGQVGHTSVLADKPKLLSDEGPVDLYGEGALTSTTVRALVRGLEPNNTEG